jgi:hypothetical protein
VGWWMTRFGSAAGWFGVQWCCMTLFYAAFPLTRACP